MSPEKEPDTGQKIDWNDSGGQRPAIIKVKSKKNTAIQKLNTKKEKLNEIQGKEAIGKKAKSSTKNKILF